jgi:cytoskeletal protein CcmA (bactofilin family)
MAITGPPKPEQTEEKAMTVIAEDVRIKGSLRFETSLMIKGPLEGEISSEGLLVVGPTAKINAAIVTGRLVSHGEIQGDVTAREEVVLKGTAIQTGSITTPSLIAESGSLINGPCVMKREAVGKSLQNETGGEGSGSGMDHVIG